MRNKLHCSWFLFFVALCACTERWRRFAGDTDGVLVYANTGSAGKLDVPTGEHYQEFYCFMIFRFPSLCVIGTIYRDEVCCLRKVEK